MPNTQYAIMLNGTWGCGKTYFWQYDLSKLAKEQNFETIYISLNGINKIESIDYQIFIKLIPFIKKQENKIFQNGLSIVTNVLNGISKKITQQTLNEILKDSDLEVFNFYGKVICFDDLERCQVPLKEVLGFINNYVEHKNLKTIILADESKINSANDDYNNIKEKVIGRILNFEINIDSIVPLLFKKYELSNKDFFDFLIIKHSLIVEILTTYNQNNLRIISFYLDTLEGIFPTIKTLSFEFINEIIFLSALITFEFKLGKLKSTDYSDFKNLNNIYRYYYSLSKESSSDDDSYGKNFYETYLRENINKYHFYPSIYSYILSGYFDYELFQDDLKKRQPEQIADEYESLTKLCSFSFRELDNDDFNNLTIKVVTYAKKGYYDIYDYARIANFFFYFVNNQLISIDIEQVHQFINEGLDLAKRNKAINNNELENLEYFKCDPDLEIVKKKIKDIHTEIEKERSLDEGKKLIHCLQNNQTRIKDIFEKHQFSKNLFENINVTDFFDALIIASNRQIQLVIDLLTNRYKASNIVDFLDTDAIFLNSLYIKINSYLIEVNLEQPKKFLLMELVKYLTTVINKLKKI